MATTIATPDPPRLFRVRMVKIDSKSPTACYLELRVVLTAEHRIWSVRTFVFALIATLLASNAAAQPKRYDAVVQGRIDAAEPGGYVGEASASRDLSRTSPALSLLVETEHMALGRSWDFSLTFDAAAQPLFVMVRTGDARVVPAFVPGETTSTGFRLAHATRSTETALVGDVGGARLNSGVARFGSDSVAVAANDMGKWALYMDGTIDFRWYPRDVSVVHRETAPLDPLFHIFAGLRHDQRLHRAGDLEPFSDPTGRVIFGFDVIPIRVLHRDSASRGVLALGGTFRFEGALRQMNRLPSGYHAAIVANLDLVRAFDRR